MKNRIIAFATFLGLLSTCNPALGMEKKPKPTIKTLQELSVTSPQVFNMSKEELGRQITEVPSIDQVTKIVHDEKYKHFIFYTKNNTFVLPNDLQGDNETLANHLRNQSNTDIYIDIHQYNKINQPIIYQAGKVVVKNFKTEQGCNAALPHLKIIGDCMPNTSTMHEVTEILSNRWDQYFSIKYTDATTPSGTFDKIRLFSISQLRDIISQDPSINPFIVIEETRKNSTLPNAKTVGKDVFLHYTEEMRAIFSKIHKKFTHRFTGENPLANNPTETAKKIHITNIVQASDEIKTDASLPLYSVVKIASPDAKKISMQIYCKEKNKSIVLFITNEQLKRMNTLLEEANMIVFTTTQNEIIHIKKNTQTIRTIKGYMRPQENPTPSHSDRYVKPVLGTLALASIITAMLAYHLDYMPHDITQWINKLFAPQQ